MNTKHVFKLSTFCALANIFQKKPKCALLWACAVYGSITVIELHASLAMFDSNVFILWEYRKQQIKFCQNFMSKQSWSCLKFTKQLFRILFQLTSSDKFCCLSFPYSEDNTCYRWFWFVQFINNNTDERPYDFYICNIWLTNHSMQYIVSH